MQKHHRLLLASGAVLLGFAAPIYAAKPIDLSKQPATLLQSFQLKPISTQVDFNGTQHRRVQQMVGDYPVFGADAVRHTPKGALTSSMNGIVYQGVEADLKGTPPIVFTTEQKNAAIKHVMQAFEKEEVSNPKADLIVYLDKSDKAHWAFHVSMTVNANKNTVAKPERIIDALSFNTYEQWNNLQTDAVSDQGGGFGGNEKVGKYIYDSLSGDLPKLDVLRDAENKTCFLQNNDVVVKDVRYNYNVYKFPCETPNEEHNKLFWNGEIDAVNGGYSAADDAMFSGMMIKNMYEDWYGESPLVENGKPMQLTMSVHLEHYDNAYWDGHQMVFGDGENVFYPLVSLGVSAHEISHGFTQQHSNLQYHHQSGGMNEAFSDMAAQAAEYFAYGKNSWQIGPEIFKAKNEALRYMDQPSKDCHGSKPGDWCSIDNAKQYTDYLDVHFSSGVYNRLFYLMGTSKGWNTRMAFNVMVQANTNYWTSNATFATGACGILSATKDYNKIDHRYDLASVKNAIADVGIDIGECS